MPKPLQPRTGFPPYSTDQNNDADQAKETSRPNRVSLDSSSTQVNQPSIPFVPPRLSKKRYLPGLDINDETRNNNLLPKFSPIKRESRSEEKNDQEISAGSPLRSPKRARLNSASFSTPERASKISTPLGTPQTPQISSLSSNASATLREIGIPEKVISIYKIILAKTYGNCALCGSAALAVHMKSAGSTKELPVGDLDVVYTGHTNSDSIAQQLKVALRSQELESDTPHGQIFMAKIRINKEHQFNIDLVPENARFATEFEPINGLNVATLESLHASYKLTAKEPNGDKSKAALEKLEIISNIKGLLDSKQAAK